MSLITDIFDKFRTKRAKRISLGVLLFLAAGFAILRFIVFPDNSVKLNSFIRVSYEGVNTYGTASLTVDEQKLANILASHGISNKHEYKFYEHEYKY